MIEIKTMYEGKVMSKSEIANAYGVDIKTLKDQLKPYHESLEVELNELFSLKKTLTPKEINKIVNLFGYFKR